MYKKALMKKMRVLTPKGELSIEKLFDLSMSDLKTVLISLDEEIKTTTGTSLDFLGDDIQVDSELQEKFDIVKDIYLSKKSEIEERQKRSENKEHNQTILKLIEEKEQEELKSLSVDELKQRLK